MKELKAKRSLDVKYYTEQIEAALARESDWRKAATEVVSIYEADKGDENSFNVLFSNTELLAPALYGRLPVPTVNRRFRDEDPIGKHISTVAQRTLAFLTDDNNPDYTSFDDLMKKATLEALVPGRGLTRIKYDAEVEGYETVCGVEVSWDRFLHGYAKRWTDVPWIAFEHFMTLDELTDLLGKVLAEKVPLTAASEAMKAEEGSLTQAQGEEEPTLGHVYEIWDKSKKQVIFLCPDYPELLKVVNDEWKLSGFFPIPKPMRFYDKISGLTPQCVYEAYRAQAEELNKVTNRIRMVMGALKVRGFYDGSVEKLGELMEAPDNTLLAADNVQILEGKGLDRLIWFAPLTELITVLQQLYLQRTQIKAVIFEITGLSDLMRGDTAASETASAQGMKNQWGSMRLKKMQREVMRYSRDLLRIMAELALTKFSQQTLAGMTGLSFPTNEQKVESQRMLAQVTQALQTNPNAQQELQNPKTVKQIEALKFFVELPSWEDLIEVLNDDLQRNYKVDIETNSTIELDEAEDKQNMAEFLNSFAQFMNGTAPLVENGTMPFEVFQNIMLTVVRRFRFGEELEDQLKKMQPPKPSEGPDPAQLEEMQKQLQQQGEAMQAEQEKFAKERQQFMEDSQKAAQQAQMDKAEFEMKQLMFKLESEAKQKEQARNQKAIMQELSLSQKSFDMENKMKEHTATQINSKMSEGPEEAEEDLDQVAEVISEGLYSLAETLSAGLMAAQAVRKTIKKLPDGSWATVIETPLQGEMLTEPKEQEDSESTVINMLKDGFLEMEQLVAKGLADAANMQKGVRKGEDGNWETFIV